MRLIKLRISFYSIFCIISILTSCKKSSVFEEINTIDKVYDLDIDSCFYVESILPLKTSEYGIINFIGKVYYVNSGYILLDPFESNIFKFDKEGNLLWKITTKGRAPGEFLHINDICLDSKEEFLYVLDGLQQNKVLRFEVLSGDFVDESEVGFQSVAFCKFGSGGFAFYTGNNLVENSDNPNCNLLLTDSTFQIVNAGLRFDEKWSGISISSGKSSFYPIGEDSILFTPQLPEIGDVYLITPETIEPYYRFVTKNSHLRSKLSKISVDIVSEWLDENSVEHNINGFWHQDDLFHFLVKSVNSNREVIYNKLTGKCYSRLTSQVSKKHAYFSPNPVFGKQTNGLFVNILPAYGIVDEEFEITSSLNKVSENDNPILVFYRINEIRQLE